MDTFFMFLFPLLIISLPALLIALLIYLIVTRRPGVIKRVEESEARFPDLFPWAAGIAVLGFNLFAYTPSFGIGWGLFCGSVMVATYLCLEPLRRTLLIQFLTLTGILAGAFFGWRANGFAQWVNAITFLLCFSALVFLRSVEALKWSALWILKMLWEISRQPLIHMKVLERAATGSAREKRSRTFFLVLRTAIITLALLLFFAYLLSSADPIFEQMVRRIREEALLRTLFSVLVLIILTFLLTLRLPQRVQEGAPQFRVLGFTEVFVPGAAIAVLFGLFLFIQAKYLFGSHSDFQSLGITYSDYVRDGFVQLLITIFFGSMLCYAIVLKQRIVGKNDQERALAILNAFLILELGLMLVSALKRDWMYVEMYGITRVRIIGCIFLAWLAGILILLLLFGTWRRMLEKLFLSGAVVLSAAVFVSLNVFNMDAYIAAATPPRNQPTDVYYISLLSADAYDGWKRVLVESIDFYESIRAKDVLTDAEKNRLVDVKLAVQELSAERNRTLAKYRAADWRDAIVSERAAFQGMEGSDRLLFNTQLDCLARSISEYQSHRGIETSEREWQRFYEYEYAFVSRSSFGLWGSGEVVGARADPPSSCRQSSQI
ncbi:MAG: Sensor protein [Candidatus Peregrinibacteria bacterium Greene0416_19]|nr:MAG: Sensor protein [Candidatus Peregrinibacteria bacterium Greene0416_19]